ncbi:MAG: myo-inosose-2 dehydratase [Alphaproteobacteria bacterium]
MIKVGISPICWQNDDLPDLTSDFTMEQALQEAREIGYIGVERGQRMPQDTQSLGAYLDKYDIALCGGWCSGSLLDHDAVSERPIVQMQVDQFIELQAPCIVYAECSNTIQSKVGVPLSTRPKLSRDEIKSYAKRLSELAKWMADKGMPLAYHHHMGTIIESEEDVNWLMEFSSREVRLCFDTGHLLFADGDVLATLDRWGDRVHHVHFKDIRPSVVSNIRENNLAFLDAVVAGAFTVPGDGCIDFQAVANQLKAMSYSGWIVVEAEQDPKKAPPKEYSTKGFEHILEVCANSELEISNEA